MTPASDMNTGDLGPDRGQAGSTPEAVALVIVDVALVRLGLRASRLLDHHPVFNDKNEQIGHIDDLMIEDDRVAFAILGVGGFLGLGEHKVAVPYRSLEITDDRIVLPGATREALKALPEFQYDM